MSKPLKIVFAGTPNIAKTILQKILDNGFAVDLVLTKPDRPSGRGNKITQSPVKELALANNIPVIQPVSFKADAGSEAVEAITKIRQLASDIIIVVAYGLILPQTLLSLPKLGCINVHVSLLPRHRGAAPIARAILSGDATSGVTIMQMDAGLDTGNILLQQSVVIDKYDTAGDLEAKLTKLGADMVIDYLQRYAEIKSIPQATDGITYAHKIEKAEALINWNEDANVIECNIRGYNPAPGCFSYLNGEIVKFWCSSLGPRSTNNVQPGTIIEATKDSLVVVCGNSTTLAIKELQPAGKGRQLAKNYILGHPNITGKVFG